MSIIQILDTIRTDIRPKWCAKIFPDFANYDILELGPSDGCNTAGLEIAGTRSIAVIEANVDSFVRCLLLKNALGLRAKFLLGDFEKYLNGMTARYDLIYAFGILYHLKDPVGFLCKCGHYCPNIYHWTLFYDVDAIAGNAFEKLCFKSSHTIDCCGSRFTYHRRIYRDEIITDANGQMQTEDTPPAGSSRRRPYGSPSRGEGSNRRRRATKYAGGVDEYACWLDKADLLRGLALAGYRVKRVVPDMVDGVSALNLWASRN